MTTDNQPVLYEAETGRPTGIATPAQIAASYANAPTGFILVDADGAVVEPGTWPAGQPGVRKCYVAHW